MSRITSSTSEDLTATKTPTKSFQAGKRMAHLFPIHHETLKRKDREAGKGR